VKQQAVTVSTKPPGGVMPSSYALADAWLAQIKTRNRNAITVTARAAWWLQPYDTVRWANVGGVMVFVQSVTFNVDQGTMVVAGYRSS